MKKVKQMKPRNPARKAVARGRPGGPMRPLKGKGSYRRGKALYFASNNDVSTTGDI